MERWDSKKKKKWKSELSRTITKRGRLYKIFAVKLAEIEQKYI